MRCEKVREWIPLLAGDDLPAGRTARLRRHLEGCPDCRRELETVRASLEAVRAAARGEPSEDWPESAWKALLARITAEGPGNAKAALGPVPRWALASAAAGVVLLAGFLLLFKDRIFRPEGISPVPGPVIVEKRESPSAPEIPPSPREPEPVETRKPDTEPRILAALKPEAEPEIQPAAPAGPTPGQDVVSVTLVSQESGLQVTWFFDKNFEWKGDQR
jgi:hypothetical protein